MFSGKYRRISENMKKIEKDVGLNLGRDIIKCKEIATEFSGIIYECMEYIDNYTYKIGKVVRSGAVNDKIRSLCDTYECIPGRYLTSQECLKLKELTGRSYDKTF